MLFDARLALYDQHEMVDLLPVAQGFDAKLPLNDDSSISFTLPAITAGEDGMAKQDVSQVYQYLYNYDVALQVSIDGSWMEPPNCRFYLVEDDVDPSKADGIQFTGVLAGGFDLSGVVGVDLSKYPGKDFTHPFTNATPGTYMATLLSEGHAAGFAPLISWDFTGTTDSDGVPWPLAVSMDLKPTATARDVLDSLTSQGLCDWRFEENTLRMFAPDSGLRRSNAEVELMLGREVTSGPQRRSVANMVDEVLVIGDAGYSLLRSRPSSRKRGPRAAVQSQGGVSQDATAILFADNVLDQGAQIRGELTRDLSFHDQCLYLPFFDYQVGDEVMAPGSEGALEWLRIFQITLSKGSDALMTGNALFGDRFLEFLTRQSRRIDGILGGSTISGGTNATPTPPPEVDIRIPSSPTGLTFDTSAFLDTNGSAFAQGFLQWNAVTTATDSTVMEVGSYDVYVRENVPGAPWSVLTSAVEPAAAWQPFAVGSEWWFKVAALGKYSSEPSGFSNEVLVTMPTDATPPGVPSAPSMSTGLGIVHATWDGLTETGMAMPVDFDHVEVAIGPGASPVTPIGSLGAAGTITHIDTPGTTQYARARAFDRSGNASAWSASASIVVASVLDDPTLDGVRHDGSLVLADTIGANQLKAGAVTADKISAGAITADKIAAGAIDATRLTVGQTVGELAGTVATQGGTLSTISNAVVIDGSGVTIRNQNPTSPQQVTISNSRLSFFSNGNEVAYIDSMYRKMFITQVEVTDTLKVGVHQIQKYDPNTTFVRWVG